jgi:hypothetical protein
MTTIPIVVLLLVALPPAQRVTFTPADEAVRAVTVAASPASHDRPSADRLTTLAADARCSATSKRSSVITLSWTTTHVGLKAFRVDLTEYHDGFTNGRFRTSGELPPGTTSLEFTEGDAGVFYYWRLLARTDAGWISAANGRFDAPICASDDGDAER